MSPVRARNTSRRLAGSNSSAPRVELVWAHDAVDLVAVTLAVVMRDRGPEPRDLEHHLGSVLAEKLEVVRDLVVVPDVVEDRRVHVTLVAAEVRVPPSREWVDMHDLRLLFAVAAALPRVHRAPEPCCLGARSCLADPAIAVHQQSPRDLRQAVVQERVHVELVPKHVAAVGLTVQPAGRHAGVVMRRQPRARLK